MTIRNQSELEARILALSDRLQTTLDLGWLRIVHKFDSRLDRAEREVAETVADWMYRQATVIWSIPLVSVLSDEDLESVMIHEFVHILNASVWESLPDKVKDTIHPLNEYATENMARALVAALRA